MYFIWEWMLQIKTFGVSKFKICTIITPELSDCYWLSTRLINLLHQIRDKPALHLKINARCIYTKFNSFTRYKSSSIDWLAIRMQIEQGMNYKLTSRGFTRIIFIRPSGPSMWWIRSRYLGIYYWNILFEQMLWRTLTPTLPLHWPSRKQCLPLILKYSPAHAHPVMIDLGYLTWNDIINE